MALSRRSLLLSLPALPAALSGCDWASRPSVPDLPFVEIDGSKHRLRDLAGSVMLINFWATSCSTCVREMPEIVATHQKFHAQGLQTLAVAMQYDPPAYVMAFARSRELPFRVVMDHTGEFARSFGPVQLTPTTFVINRRGEIVKRYIGEPDFEAMNKLIAKLLTEPKLTSPA